MYSENQHIRVPTAVSIAELSGKSPPIMTTIITQEVLMDALSMIAVGGTPDRRKNHRLFVETWMLLHI